MAEETGISWTDSTANLWIGCQHAGSPACDHCYAEDLMGGLGEERQEGAGRRMARVQWGPDGERSFCKQGWVDLRKWQRAAERNGGLDPKLGRRRVVFINSLSDFFDNHRSIIWRAEAWQLFRECTHLILILVTKRPQLIARELPAFWDEIAGRIVLMTTAETQEWADRRVPELLSSCAGRAAPLCYAASIEPMLGPIDLTRIALVSKVTGSARAGIHIDALRGRYVESGLPYMGAWDITKPCPDWPPARLGWVIIGGESGKHARPLYPAWPHDLIAQCIGAGVPVDFKQWGEWFPVMRLAVPNSASGQIEVQRVKSVAIDGKKFEGDAIHHFEDLTPMVRLGKAKSGARIGGKIMHERPQW